MKISALNILIVIAPRIIIRTPTAIFLRTLVEGLSSASLLFSMCEYPSTQFSPLGYIFSSLEASLSSFSSWALFYVGNLKNWDTVSKRLFIQAPQLGKMFN